MGKLIGKGWIADLSDDGTWTCNDAIVLIGLQMLHSDYSEADGDPGIKMLNEAAQDFRAELELSEEQ